MSQDWNSIFSANAANLNADGSIIESFGDLKAELDAAAAGLVVAPLTHLAILEVTGDDARDFLHSQLTNDVNHLQQGQAQHAAWCSAKGRMLASFVVWRNADDAYRLLLSRDLAPAIKKRLQMFVLRSKVKINDLQESVAIMGISGQQNKALADWPLPVSPLQAAFSAPLEFLGLDEQRALVVSPLEQASAIWAKLSTLAKPVGRQAWLWLDVQHAFPLVTQATQEEFVPQMADFEKMGGVSFHKGCYPGQEVVARTQYLGKVKRHLYRVTSSHALSAGDSLFSPEHPDQASGQILTGAPGSDGQNVGLAVVQAMYADSLHLKTIDGPQVQAHAVNP